MFSLSIFFNLFIYFLIKHIYVECLLCIRHLDNFGLWASVKITLSNIKIMSKLEIEYDLEMLGSNFNFHPLLACPLPPANAALVRYIMRTLYPVSEVYSEISIY